MRVELSGMLANWMRILLISFGLLSPFYFAQAGVVFVEDFESPEISNYVQGSVPPGWVKANQGFNSTRHGMVNKESGDFAAPDPNNQAYSFRYTNSGITTAEGALDSLQANGTYTVTFDVVMNNATTGTIYNAELIAFGEGELRNDCRSTPANSTVLASTNSNSPADGTWQTVSFNFTADAATHSAELDKDLAIRFRGATSGCIIDNIKFEVDFPTLVAPEYFSIVSSGDVQLEWLNPASNQGSDVWVDVWFGNQTNGMSKVVEAGQNLTDITVNAPLAETYLWQVDYYLDGSPNGVATEGNRFTFFVDDTDSDGLPDIFELEFTDPQSNISMNPGDDDDSDGLTNLEEYTLGGDPTNPDMDGDSLLDGDEIAGAGMRPPTDPFDADTDGDTLSDEVESNTGIYVSTSNTGSNPILADTDTDGLPDDYEVANAVPASGTAMDPSADQDGDSLTNLEEYNLGTNPNSTDTDGDNLDDDGELVGIGNRPATDPLLADTDGDGLDDDVESNTGTWVSAADTGTDPTAKDTDKDGLIDGVESNTSTFGSRLDTGTDPLLADTDADGANDWYESASAWFTDPNDNQDEPEFDYPLPDPDSSPTDTLKPIKVFILAGQSNMVGMGELGSGSSGNYPLGTPGTLETVTQLDHKFSNLIDASNNWTVRNDAYIYEARISSYPYTQGGITPGVVNGSSTMGPEIQFGHLMGETFDEDVILIKTAQGNRSLAWDFRPPSSGRNDPASPWESLEYTLMLDGVNNVLDNLDTNYPNYAGQGYEIAGFVWFQGHKDGTNTAYADEYEWNLVNLINDVRTDFGVPDLPVVIASIGFNGWEMDGDEVTVWQAQRAVANPTKYPQFEGNVYSVDTRGLWIDAVDSPKNEYYHYNRNAEFYALCGDAAGRAMYRMLAGLPVLPFGEDLEPTLNALKSHVTGANTLSEAEIENRIINLQANSGAYALDSQKTTAAIDFITSYENNFGGLFTANSATDGGWGDRDAVPNDIHRAAFIVMQAIMDEVYTAENIIANEALLDGYKFDSADFFPGAVAPPISITTHTATIDGSYPDTAGWDHLHDDFPARKPTGTYLAPGSIVTVTVPPELVNSGYQIRVGGHFWDMSDRKPVRRLDRVSLTFDITNTGTKIANPLGGGIYIDVPKFADAGIVNVDITGAVRSPYFSAKSFHTTTLNEWQTTERNHPGPWADFQTEKFMMMLPTDWIYNWDDPATVLAEHDISMDMINELIGFPTIRGKETMYPTIDLLNKSAVFAPGYPSVNSTTNPDNDYEGLANHYLITGPEFAPDYYFHEKGHGFLFPKFGGESESTVNLLHVAVLNRGFGYDLDFAFRDSRGFGNNAGRTLDTTAIAWMTVFNFTPYDQPMATGEKAYQLKGHAKFVDSALLFGWQAVNDFHKAMTDTYEASGNKPTYTSDELIFIMSEAVGEDCTPLFHFWGIHPQDPIALANAISAANLPQSNKIYDRLAYYRTIVPANLADFRAFADAWYNGPPSINGAWQEREHTRQYDSTNYWELNFWTYAGTDPNQLDGEVYNTATTARIQAKIDALLAQYFPSGDPQPDQGPPSPNPMSFAVAPYALGEESVSMVATTATDEAVVEYYFTETSGNPGGNDSGWQSSTAYTDTGLAAGVTYTYTVTARDKSPSQYATAASSPVDVTTTIDLDPPTPDPMTWAQVPVAAGGGGVSLTENFESPMVNGYSQGTLPNNSNWVGSNDGFGSNRKGIVNKDSGHFTASDPNTQGFAFRYTNTGITTAEGAFGVLESGVTYTVVFDVVRDDGLNLGTSYKAQLIAFPAGADRSDHRSSGLPSGATILAELSGNAPSDGTWDTVSFQFTPDSANHAAELGMDLGVRFLGATTSAIIDNFSIDTGAPFITMEASIATDAETGSNVEYYFEEMTGNPGATDSGWQTGTVYTDTGLSDGYTYIYTVRARDLSGSLNETTASTPASATVGTDEDPPTPNPMTWVQMPIANGVSLIEDFEDPSISGYSQGALPNNSNWVGSNAGFGSNRRGIVNKDSGHFSASDPNMQAFAFRYTNSGMTTAEGAFAALEDGTTYTVSFDVVRDDGKNAGTPYKCQLIAFPAGTNRTDHRSLPTGAVLLTEVSGDAPSDGTWATVDFQFTPDSVSHANELGMDLGVRFIGTTTSAIIDNFSITAGAPFIIMEASVATDVGTGSNIEYYFEETSGNPGATDSGWQTGTSYTDIDLSYSYTYTYEVRARDLSSSLNETMPSASASATVGVAVVDTVPPTPDPMTWAQVPVATVVNGGTSLTEDFESPLVTGYSEGILPTNGNWIGSSLGYGSGRRGIVDKDSGHFSASDPNMQAFAFRYTNSGITTAEGILGNLTDGIIYNVSFDVVRDDGLNAGTYYRCELIAFPSGANRTDHSGSALPNGAVLLASVTGNAPSDGTWSTVNFQFTPDSVIHANEIGMDVGVRFRGATTSAIIDNFSIDTGAPFITMEASAATDGETGSNVEYYFEETSGNPGANDSGWQSDTVYADTGLSDGYTYTYTVRARDLSSSLNETTPSAPASATTMPNSD